MLARTNPHWTGRFHEGKASLKVLPGRVWHNRSTSLSNRMLLHWLHR